MSVNSELIGSIRLITSERCPGSFSTLFEKLEIFLPCRSWWYTLSLLLLKAGVPLPSDFFGVEYDCAIVSG